MAARRRRELAAAADPFFAAEMAELEHERFEASRAAREAFSRDWAERLKRPITSKIPASKLHHHIEDCRGPTSVQVIPVGRGRVANARGWTCTHTHAFVVTEVLT